MSHYNQLIDAFYAEWPEPSQTHSSALGCTLHNDTARYWWVTDSNGAEVISWECRRFPGCDTLIITTKADLRSDLRGIGLGRFFRELRHRAYKRAGFVGELATVRTDNAAQNRLMQTMGGVAMGEFRSDFGGTFKLWLTQLLAHRDSAGRLTPPRWLDEPPRVNVAVQSRLHEADLTSYVIETTSHADLDAIALTPPTVQPLPGDGSGLHRRESDESLRARIKKYSHWK